MTAMLRAGRFGTLGVVLVLAGLAGGCATVGWRHALKRELPALGERNWILIADSAYPDQVLPGARTIATGADQLRVIRTVLKALDASPHVRAKLYLDAEIRHVAEARAPGIDAFRKALNTLVAGRPVQAWAQEDLVKKFNEAAATYRVLVLKTESVLPYTSVFVELECGYWSDDAERELRNIIQPVSGVKPAPKPAKP